MHIVMIITKADEEGLGSVNGLTNPIGKVLFYSKISIILDFAGVVLVH